MSLQLVVRIAMLLVGVFLIAVAVLLPWPSRRSIDVDRSRMHYEDRRYHTGDGYYVAREGRWHDVRNGVDLGPVSAEIEAMLNNQKLLPTDPTP